MIMYDVHIRKSLEENGRVFIKSVLDTNAFELSFFYFSWYLRKFLETKIESDY